MSIAEGGALERFRAVLRDHRAAWNNYINLPANLLVATPVDTANLVAWACFWRSGIQCGDAEALAEITHIFHKEGLPKKARKAIETVSLVRHLEGVPPGARYAQLQAYSQERDGQNMTPLMRFLHFKLYKHAARFIACRVANIWDSGSPIVSGEERDQIQGLRNGVRELIRGLNDSAPTRLYQAIRARSDPDPAVISIQKLEEMNQIDEIKPLMSFANLATLGRHQLLDDSNTDSDDENADTPMANRAIANRQHQRFIIELDRGSPYIENIYLDPQRRRVSGIYHPRGSDIYVGAMVGPGNPPEQIRSFIAHELTHFVVHQVFANRIRPYKANDAENLQKFRDITADLRGRLSELDPCLKIVFEHEVYNTGTANEIEEKHHQELIVKVPEMLVRYKNDNPNGLARLTAQAPQLLNYYHTVFMPAVESHIAKCKEKAFGSWPEDVLKEGILNTVVNVPQPVIQTYEGGTFDFCSGIDNFFRNTSHIISNAGCAIV